MLTTTMFVCFVLAVTVDWGREWDEFIIYSGRLENYTTTLPLLTVNNTWLTGLGFNFLERLNQFRDVRFLDSFYLWTLLESGVVGFILLVGTIIGFSFMYFRDTRYMSKSHRLTGGLLAVMLWYGLFEARMYGSNAVDMLNWILLIAAMNERYALIRHVTGHQMCVNAHEVRLNILHNS